MRINTQNDHLNDAHPGTGHPFFSWVQLVMGRKYDTAQPCLYPVPFGITRSLQACHLGTVSAGAPFFKALWISKWPSSWATPLGKCAPVISLCRDENGQRPKKAMGEAAAVQKAQCIQGLPRPWCLPKEGSGRGKKTMGNGLLQGCWIKKKQNKRIQKGMSQ